MFGIARIARQTRRWRETRSQMKLVNLISTLSVELQKDIGWPAPADRHQPRRQQRDTHARPIL